MKKILKTIRNWIRPELRSSGRIAEIRETISIYISKVIGLIERIQEVILFIPVLFKCITWDHSSIYLILKHWFSRMEIAQRGSCHLNAPKYATQLRVCIFLLNRLYEDNYHESIFESHDLKWGEPEYNFEKKENSEFSYFTSKRKNVQTKEDETQERSEYRLLMNKEESIRSQDIEMLFNLIKKNHRHWWC